MLTPGTTVDKYEIVRLLGEGGMGVVYEAVHVGLKKRVAVKVLRRWLASDAKARRLFLREGEAASRISHPNVVNVTDLGTVDDVPFLVMELLEGEDFGRLCARRGALPPAELTEIMLAVIAGVAAGHERGVIHRDLKPPNIFLARDQRGEITPKVLDFGLSQVAGGGSGKAPGATGVRFGTLAYLSPEQAAGASVVDERTDQYALGLVLYEGATGRRAHQGDTVAELLRHVAAGLVAPPRSVRPELPQELEAVVVRALAVRPADRWGSLYELGRALLPFAPEAARVRWRSLFGDAPAAASRGAARRRAGRRRRLAIGVGAGLALGAAAAALVVSQRVPRVPVVASPAEARPSAAATERAPVGPAATPTLQPAPAVRRAKARTVRAEAAREGANGAPILR
jgi:serine/threonine-protein kinase